MISSQGEPEGFRQTEGGKRKMAKKGLVIYASWTGNTEKVALRFQKVFEKYGWECDMLKVTKHTDVKTYPRKLTSRR